MVAKKHLCPTCGFKIKRPTTDENQTKSTQTSEPSQTFWSKLIRWDFDSPATQKTDSTQEKPAVLH